MIPWQTLLFSLVFAVSAGLAVMGGLVSVRYASGQKKATGPFLIYQQLFVYAFLLFAVWGNLALQKFMEGWEVTEAVRSRVMMVQPLIGLPFLMASWYMLIRFFLEISGNKWGKRASLGYLILCAAIFPLLFLLAEKTELFTGKAALPGTVADAANAYFPVYMVIAAVNGALHLLLLVPVLLNFKKVTREECPESRLFMPAYFLSVGASTLLTLLSPERHYLFALSAILTIFLANLLLPLCTGGIAISENPRDLRGFQSFSPEENPIETASQTFRDETEVNSGEEEVPAEQESTAGNFEVFCLKYEISRREAEIIREIQAGKSNREIAGTLFITLQTVKDHIHRIFTKTGVSNRVQLINLTQQRLL